MLNKKFKGKVKSPGMKYRHYAPKATLILIDGNLKGRIKKIQKLINLYQKQKKRVGIMTAVETKKFYKNADLTLAVGSRKNLKEIAKNLFKVLRKFDKQKIDIILAEGMPEKGIGFAIMHRLKKAAYENNQIYVKMR